MDSAGNSPGRQTVEKTHTELLQAFQSFKPGRRGASKTPQPPPASKTRRSSTPVTNAGQAIRAGLTAFEMGSPDTPPSTQETTTTANRKRTHKAPSTELFGDQESSDDEVPMAQASKRPRQTSTLVEDMPVDASTAKRTNTIPSQMVQVQIQNGRAQIEKVAAKALQHIDSSTQAEKGRASSTPEFAAASVEGTPGQQQAILHHHPATSPAPQTAQSSKVFATQLLQENQKFEEALSQKNGTFLRSIPSSAASSLEKKLAKVTAELTRLHQEKVDAIRLEYVAELQRDMDERQKVINMLLQKSDS